MDDMTLARTYVPMACMDCQSSGLTVEHCATLHSAGLHAAMAFADDEIKAARTTQDAVVSMRAKGEAKRRLNELRSTPPSARVALVDSTGFPFAILDRNGPAFRHALPRLTETSEPSVFVFT